MHCYDKLQPKSQEGPASNPLKVSLLKKARHCPCGPPPGRQRQKTTSAGDFKDVVKDRIFKLLSCLPAPYTRPPIRPQNTTSGYSKTDFTFLTFPVKLWNIVESDAFLSVWWTVGGTAIVIDQEMFKKEILERNVPRIFASRNMKHFHQHLKFNGFISTEFDNTGDQNQSQLNSVKKMKLQIFSSPYFRRDHKHLLGYFEGQEVKIPAGEDGKDKGAGCFTGDSGRQVTGSPVPAPPPSRPSVSSFHLTSFPASPERGTQAGETPRQLSIGENTPASEVPSFSQNLQSQVYLDTVDQLKRFLSSGASQRDPEQAVSTLMATIFGHEMIWMNGASTYTPLSKANRQSF